mmetsp:Transcript_11743/g.20171  ORF Transcript_11743/g.20171 Transcript_11743/m.20171 type:complete len:203 (-) Transcript_11743:819-1427(-)
MNLSSGMQQVQTLEGDLPAPLRAACSASARAHPDLQRRHQPRSRRAPAHGTHSISGPRLRPRQTLGESSRASAAFPAEQRLRMPTRAALLSRVRKPEHQTDPQVVERWILGAQLCRRIPGEERRRLRHSHPRHHRGRHKGCRQSERRCRRSSCRGSPRVPGGRRRLRSRASWSLKECHPRAPSSMHHSQAMTTWMLKSSWQF